MIKKEEFKICEDCVFLNGTYCEYYGEYKNPYQDADDCEGYE